MHGYEKANTWFARFVYYSNVFSCLTAHIILAMTADTRAAISAMVQGHGAAPDEVTWGAYSGTTAEEDAWMEVDEDEGPVDTSHEGGEYGDSVNVLISEMTSAR